MDEPLIHLLLFFILLPNGLLQICIIMRAWERCPYRILPHPPPPFTNPQILNTQILSVSFLKALYKRDIHQFCHSLLQTLISNLLQCLQSTAGRRTSYSNPLLRDKEQLLSVHLVSEVHRSFEVKQTDSASSPVISKKCGDGRRSDDTARFSDCVHNFLRWRYIYHLHLIVIK